MDVFKKQGFRPCSKGKYLQPCSKSKNLWLCSKTKYIFPAMYKTQFFYGHLQKTLTYLWPRSKDKNVWTCSKSKQVGTYFSRPCSKSKHFRPYMLRRDIFFLICFQDVLMSFCLNHLVTPCRRAVSDIAAILVTLLNCRYHSLSTLDLYIFGIEGNLKEVLSKFSSCDIYYIPIL